MVVRAGAAKPDISSVEAFRSTLLAAKSIAYSDSGSGTYLSTRLFPKLGIAEEVAGKSRKVRGPPSGEPVAAVVARGEAEIGFQQVSELIHVPGVTFVGTIPAEVQLVSFFAGALTSTVQQPEAAIALLRFLASPEAAPVISKAGLKPLSERWLARSVRLSPIRFGRTADISQRCRTTRCKGVRTSGSGTSDVSENSFRDSSTTIRYGAA